MRILLRAWGACILGLLVVLAPARAAFPGADGRIVFESDRDGNREVYVMQADGSAQTRLTHGPADDVDPVFSPDGSTIAFTSRRDGNAEVYVMNADGSAQTRLTHNTVSDGQPAFSADGLTIAFLSDRDVSFPQVFDDVYEMDAVGAGQARMGSETLFGRGGGLVFSPDGERLAFADDAIAAGASNLDLYVRYVDEYANAYRGRTRMTTAAAADSAPAFSPDSLRIAFDSDRAGNDDVYVMRADGGGQARLTTSPAEDGAPAFSPAGARIAFTSRRDGNAEVYVMSAVGGGQTNLTHHGANDRSPDWAPDPASVAPRAAESVRCPSGTSSSVRCTRERTGRTRMSGGVFAETFVGTGGRDYIVTGGGDDRVNARGGNDLVDAGPGRTRVNGGRGNDRLYGHDDNDRLSGGPGNDRLYGDMGNDRLFGGSGRDRLSGSFGRDRLSGGSGRDRLNCGPGRDVLFRSRGDRVSRTCERR